MTSGRNSTAVLSATSRASPSSSGSTLSPKSRRSSATSSRETLSFRKTFPNGDRAALRSGRPARISLIAPAMPAPPRTTSKKPAASWPTAPPSSSLPGSPSPSPNGTPARTPPSPSRRTTIPRNKILLHPPTPSHLSLPPSLTSNPSSPSPAPSLNCAAPTAISSVRKWTFTTSTGNAGPTNPPPPSLPGFAAKTPRQPQPQPQKLPPPGCPPLPRQPLPPPPPFPVRLKADHTQSNHFPPITKNPTP